MSEYLVFTLASTLASMGDVAGHERRGSWTWPGRSAILGLLAAARGMRRDGDFTEFNGLKVSVAVFDSGTPLRDYHTVQTVPSAAVRHPQSRPEALGRVGARVNTMISLRDYRSNCLYGVAAAGEGLPALAEALGRPCFHLYLGRKACPLSAPLAPKLVAAETPEAALVHIMLPPWHANAVARVLYAEDGVAERVETRHDTPLDRRLWHFATRNVCMRRVEIRPETAP